MFIRAWLHSGNVNQGGYIDQPNIRSFSRFCIETHSLISYNKFPLKKSVIDELNELLMKNGNKTFKYENTEKVLILI